MEDEAKAQAERLEAAFSDELLERMVKAGGQAVGDGG
jgi:Mn-dependent DtxR family transcriptional regulator